MTQKRLCQLVVAGALASATACAQGDCISAFKADNTTCHWVKETPTSEAQIVCVNGTVTIRVDTSGIGTGGGQN